MTKNTPPVEIDITITEEAWKRLSFPLRQKTRETVLLVLEQAGCMHNKHGTSIEVSILLACDEYIRTLNRDYRGMDKATNVLSFPQYERGQIPESGPLFLGDIILALDTVDREAAEQGKSLEDHYIHLIVHGTLHLLGYDHMENDEAEEMENLEKQILTTLGIKNPYEN